MPRLTSEQIEQIVTLAEKGKTGGWVARHLGINSATVNYQMLIAGYDPWPGRRLNEKQVGAFSPAEDARLVELSKVYKLPTVAKLMKRPRTSCRIRLLTLEVRAEAALEAA